MPFWGTLTSRERDPGGEECKAVWSSVRAGVDVDRRVQEGVKRLGNLSSTHPQNSMWRYYNLQRIKMTTLLILTLTQKTSLKNTIINLVWVFTMGIRCPPSFLETHRTKHIFFLILLSKLDLRLNTLWDGYEMFKAYPVIIWPCL